jgi:hypothetical protein
MRLKTIIRVFVAALFGIFVATSVIPKQGQAATDDAGLITSAMSAAPAPVAQGATVVAMSADGSMRVLRQGTNGFTCIPDDVTTPGNDPMCLDANAMEWARAWMTHATPPDKIGFMYMLAGGSDASSTDPYAKSPSPGNHWVATGPHVMIVGPGAALMAGYPTSPEPDVTKPYVMWAGTPYTHLMIPIQMK